MPTVASTMEPISTLFAQPPEVDIVLIRHAQAVSNVACRDNQDKDAIDPLDLPASRLLEWAQSILDGRDDVLPILTACFLPDGLTQNALARIHHLVNQLQGSKLPNTYLLVCSGLTRAWQTLDAMKPAFELVGNGEPERIRNHADISEASPWPQDLPPCTKDELGQLVTSYIQIKGGSGPDSGDVVGEVQVNFGNSITVDDIGIDDWETPEGRLCACINLPDEAQLEFRVKRFRHWLREQAFQVAQEHQASRRAGIPKIVVVVHGGINMFLMEDWHAKFNKDPRSTTTRWNWGGSRITNLGAIVARFASATDETASLVEKPFDAEYDHILGGHYVRLDPRPNYLYDDGTPVDAKEKHLDFIGRVSEEVQEVYGRHPDTLKLLLSWTGCQDAIDESMVDEY